MALHLLQYVGENKRFYSFLFLYHVSYFNDLVWICPLVAPHRGSGTWVVDQSSGEAHALFIAFGKLPDFFMFSGVKPTSPIISLTAAALFLI